MAKRIIFSAVLCSIAAFAPLYAHADGFYIRPHIQTIDQSGATLIWETEQSVSGAIHYGPKGGVLDQIAKEEVEQKLHRVRLTDLKANTEYTYRIQAGDDVQEASFITAPNDERDITFVVVGDSRRWAKRWDETGMNEHVKQWNADVYLTMGDLVVDGHNYEQWPEHFERFADLTKSKWFVTARGNHEGSQIRNIEEDWFAKYHELPGDGEPYAYFDWGNTHFVLISYESTGREKDWTKSAQWLDQHLAQVDKPYTVVAHHFPVYCTGYYGPTLSRKEPGIRAKEFRDVMDKHNVTLNATGHTHIYERHYPLRDDQRDDRNGTHYVVNGGDINGNFPDWWTAVSDDRDTMAKPTYTVYQCKADRIISRTFAWSKVDEKIVEIDYFVIWQDESIPKAVLDDLPNLTGEALLSGIEDLSAMLYAPAAKPLLAYLESSEPNLRHQAAKSLALLGNEDVSGDFLNYVTNDDTTIATYAARALEVSMPKSAAKQVAQWARDSELDDRVRISLTGALLFHAPVKLAYDTFAALLDDATTQGRLRERAAYCLRETATQRDVQRLIKLFETEESTYVMLTLAAKLNELTGNRNNLSSRGDLVGSNPGERQEFVDKWLR